MSRPHSLLLGLSALNVLSIALLSLSTSDLVSGIACDYEKYQATGCADQETSACDPSSGQCICRQGLSIKVKGRCLPYRAVNEQCYSSRQCVKMEGKCLNPLGAEVNASEEEEDIPNVFTSNLFAGITTALTGFCACPEGFFHNLERRQCQPKVLGQSCSTKYDCLKTNTFCDEKCQCDAGYFADILTDTCKSVRSATGIGTSPGPEHSSHGCEFGFVWDQVSHKCRLLSYQWDPARSWSSLIWKIAVLCIVLVLLMMLVGGIQRARHNDNLVSWTRAIEAYQARSLRSSDLSSAARRRPLQPTELRIMMSSYAPTNGSAAPSYPRDDPPSYEEAITMNSGPRPPAPAPAPAPLPAPAFGENQSTR